jgi:hypothetical protein
MIGFLAVALFASAAPGRCTVPESMPKLNEAMVGEGETDWCMMGADPFAVAGPDLDPLRQVVIRDPETRRVQIVQWRRSAHDLLPASWERVFARPAVSAPRGEFAEVLIQVAGDTLIIVTTNPAWRIGNAVCAGEGGTSAGYLPTGRRATVADRGAITRLTARPDDGEPSLAISTGQGRELNPDEIEQGAAVARPINSGNIMCTLLVGDGEGYRLSFYGPQGKPLADVDDFYRQARARIVASGDYEVRLGVNR